MVYVTDTHSLVWFFNGEETKLGKEALVAFLEVEDGKAKMVIPSIVLAEIVYLAEKERLGLQFKEVIKKLEESSNYLIYPLNLEIVMRTSEMHDMGDIHDRIIAATVKQVDGILITKDPEIQAHGSIKTIW